MARGDYLFSVALKLFLEGHSAEETVQGLAARHAVFVVVPTTMGERDQVFNACLRLTELLPAEEAVTSLGEEQPLQRGGGHCYSCEMHQSQSFYPENGQSSVVLCDKRPKSGWRA
jgi:hypothetical protein